MAIDQNYIGKGIIFPVELDSKGFSVIRTGILLINSSIKMILSTPLRQRIFLGKFGSGVENTLGEPNDDVLKGLVEHYIYDSLKNWEQRIIVTAITIARTRPEAMDVSVYYTVKTTGLEGVLTFPFYKSLPY